MRASAVRAHRRRQKSRRRLVFEKTNGRCWYCGRKILYKDGNGNGNGKGNHGKEDIRFTIDHFVPKSLGGPCDISNLVPACEVCNNEKADLSIDEYRFVKTMERFKEANGVSFTSKQTEWLQDSSRGLKLEKYRHQFWFELGLI